MSIVLFSIGTSLLYLGFFVLNWLGGEHWAYYPTVFLTASLVLLHLLGAFIQLRKNGNENKNNRN